MWVIPGFVFVWLVCFVLFCIAFVLLLQTVQSFYCCITTYKLRGLKHHQLLILQFCGTGIWAQRGLAGFLYQGSHNAKIKMLVRVSSEAQGPLPSCWWNSVLS